MKVEIDRNSGFCGGVIRAIGTAERYLGTEGGKLFSLGSIVHNEEELHRLAGLGLVAIERDDLDGMDPVHGEHLLIRAHGEPPYVYDRAAKLGFDVIDCTCPVVLKLQADIREAYSMVHPRGGSVLIFGKIGHPEVMGLVGQVDGDAAVVESADHLRLMLQDGTVRSDRDIELFSQTTMSPVGYAQIRTVLQESMSGEACLSVHDTVCSQVASRHRDLSDFALAHDVVVFVSGMTSSNGKVLCDLCKRVNIRTYNIGAVSEVESAWFREDDRVGVCGATSTPKWLLEQVAAAIENLH